MLETEQETLHPPDAELPDAHPLELRRIEFQDIPKVVELLVEVLPTIKTYARVSVAPNRLRTLMQANVDNPEMYGRILVYDTQIVGVGLGFVTRYAFSNEYHAQDILLYIAPKHRKSTTFGMLVRDFCTWADSMNAKQIFLTYTAGVHAAAHSRLMASFGFEEVGRILVKGA